MSEEGIKSTWRCAECGRENPASAALCALCLTARPGAAAIVPVLGPAPRSFPPDADEDYPSFARTSDFERRLPGLTNAFLIGICILLAAIYGVGLLLFLILLPAVLHLYRLDRERAGGPTTVRRAFIAGLAGFCIAALTVASVFITFVGVCFPTGAYAITGLEHEGYPTQILVWVGGLVAGLLSAVGVGYGIVRLCFLRGKRRREPPPD